MIKQYTRIWVMIALMFLCLGQAPGTAGQINPSGEIVNGFRVLPGTTLEDSIQWIVFRGDYIKFKIEPSSNAEAPIDPLLSIPSLSIEKSLVSNLEKAPYFKMKKLGKFDVFLGSLNGTLTVVEYNQFNYQAVSAQEAQKVIDVFKPILLDVRTPGEYSRGHLENSVLIPVQNLQSRLDELADYKDEPILIYCASGNRSTVASKILIDKGFTRIFNLRRGIGDWIKHRYPIVK
jgi:rhodanese-related sulfurtransferase